MACNAVLGALLSRHRTGEGQSIEIALFDNAVLMTGDATMQHMFTRAVPQCHGNTSPDTCPSGVFMSRDKPFYINCGNDKIFHRLMNQVLGRLPCRSACSERHPARAAVARAPAPRHRGRR